MSVTKSVFGETKNGERVDSFLIENKNGMKINCITFGAALQAAYIKDKDGKEIDVLVGFDDMAGLRTAHATKTTVKFACTVTAILQQQFGMLLLQTHLPLSFHI